MLRSKCRAVRLFVRSLLLKQQNGSASLEFLVTALVLLVPMLYLMIFLAEFQAKSFAAENITRHSALVLASNENELSSAEVVAEVVSSVSSSFGISAPDFNVSVHCVSSTQNCAAPGELILLRAESVVTPPLLPDWFGLDRALSFTVVSEQALVVG